MSEKIWKTDGFTSPTAEATMAINNPSQSPPVSETGIYLTIQNHQK